MLKRFVAGSVTLALVSGLVFGRDLFSYVSTACSNVREAVKSEISPEFELQRIQKEIDGLMPEIRRHLTVVAEQTVDLKDLERQVTDKELALSTQKEGILALRNDLASEQDRFTYRHVSYTRSEVEADLAHRFDAFRTGEAALKRDQQILAAQRQTLQANQKHLNAMLERKQGLAVQVSQLEARLKTIQATEAVNSLEIDDTRLSRVEGMIRDLNRALDVRETLLETEGQFPGRIPVGESDTENHGNVLSEVDQHFGLSGAAEPSI
ncbi:MAG: hypothetical protein KDA89_14405 [Planctomycetaceae bacterium]|nr:hypothetical protein [Planctomycetaceae bacterium]